MMSNDFGPWEMFGAGLSIFSLVVLVIAVCAVIIKTIKEGVNYYKMVKDDKRKK